MPKRILPIPPNFEGDPHKIPINLQAWAVGGWDFSFNPDDHRLYLCRLNKFCELEVMTTFKANNKGFSNARYWMRCNPRF